MTKSIKYLGISMAAALALTACNDSEGSERSLNDLDAQLTNIDGDPAVEGALEEEILIDPNLEDTANGNAVRAPGAPSNGALPNNYNADATIVSAEELNEIKLISAGKPRMVSDDELCTDCAAQQQGMTLGAKADIQQSRGKGTCDAKLTYDMAWASRMPTEFPVFPKAQVQEAAGVDGGLCDIRAVTFYSPNAMQNVVDYYYTRAKKTGYSAEYVLRDGMYALGGTRDNDDGAYYIQFQPRKGGGTIVDIVANNGR